MYKYEIWEQTYFNNWNYRHKHLKKWLFIKHEDLSYNPVENFREIFNFIEINFTQDIKEVILSTTESDTSTDLYRNSKGNIKKWKTILNDEEVDLIKIKTETVWKNFYSCTDW